MAGTWRAASPIGEITLSDTELRRFGLLCVRKPELLARISRLFLFDMFLMNEVYGISPAEILLSITHLEAGEGTTGIKPAAPFKHAPLKGLWHKHFFAARFLAHNIELGLGKDGLRQIVESVLLPHIGTPPKQEMFEEIAYRITREPIEKRHAAGKITGEWLVFVKNAGKNYYLCITTHNYGDSEIYDRIMELAIMDFPSLREWITPSDSTQEDIE